MGFTSEELSALDEAATNQSAAVDEDSDEDIVKSCCWCGGPFVRIDKFYWCSTPACRQLQAEHSLWVQSDDGKETHYLYVPLPRQVDFDRCKSRYLLGGGSAGSTKSYAGRWSMYRRGLRFEGYTGLILRQSWGELESTHFELMENEQHIFKEFKIDANFSITNRQFTFRTSNGRRSIIEGGHMDDAKHLNRYLGRERDEIMVDEGSLFNPRHILELSTRARTTKQNLLAAGIRGLFRVYTNPGGPSSSMLRDFFINHAPDWEKFPKKLRTRYNPDDWTYIPGRLEDNPYLDDSYADDLLVLEPWRYEQLRYNNWDIVAGLFFETFRGRPPFVQDLGEPGSSVRWFRSMDWGYVNPGCFLWWACLPDGILYIRHELKFSHKLIGTVAEEVHEATKDLGVEHISYTEADPALWKTYSGDSGELIEETFRKPPNRLPMRPGDNNRINGWQRVRELLKIRPDSNPTLVIHPSCRYLIRSLSEAVSSKSEPEDVDTTIDDHALDALRYGGMSRPSPSKTSNASSGKTFKAAQQRIKDAKRRASVR